MCCLSIALIDPNRSSMTAVALSSTTEELEGPATQFHQSARTRSERRAFRALPRATRPRPLPCLK
jgi:hypothetical protein